MNPTLLSPLFLKTASVAAVTLPTLLRAQTATRTSQLQKSYHEY